VFTIEKVGLETSSIHPNFLAIDLIKVVFPAPIWPIMIITLCSNCSTIASAIVSMVSKVNTWEVYSEPNLVFDILYGSLQSKFKDSECA
jgi:hypothetical protein